MLLFVLGKVTVSKNAAKGQLISKGLFRGGGGV